MISAASCTWHCRETVTKGSRARRAISVYLSSSSADGSHVALACDAPAPHARVHRKRPDRKTRSQSAVRGTPDCKKLDGPARRCGAGMTTSAELLLNDALLLPCATLCDQYRYTDDHCTSNAPSYALTCTCSCHLRSLAPYATLCASPDHVGQYSATVEISILCDAAQLP